MKKNSCCINSFVVLWKKNNHIERGKEERGSFPNVKQQNMGTRGKKQKTKYQYSRALIGWWWNNFEKADQKNFKLCPTKFVTKIKYKNLLNTFYYNSRCLRPPLWGTYIKLVRQRLKKRGLANTWNFVTLHHRSDSHLF